MAQYSTNPPSKAYTSREVLPISMAFENDLVSQISIDQNHAPDSDEAILIHGEDNQGNTVCLMTASNFESTYPNITNEIRENLSEQFGALYESSESLPQNLNDIISASRQISVMCNIIENSRQDTQTNHAQKPVEEELQAYLKDLSVRDRRLIYKAMGTTEAEIDGSKRAHADSSNDRPLTIEEEFAEHMANMGGLEKVWLTQELESLSPSEHTAPAPDTLSI